MYQVNATPLLTTEAFSMATPTLAGTPLQKTPETTFLANSNSAVTRSAHLENRSTQTLQSQFAISTAKPTLAPTLANGSTTSRMVDTLAKRPIIPAQANLRLQSGRAENTVWAALTVALDQLAQAKNPRLHSIRPISKLASQSPSLKSLATFMPKRITAFGKTEISVVDGLTVPLLVAIAATIARQAPRRYLRRSRADHGMVVGSRVYQSSRAFLRRHNGDCEFDVLVLEQGLGMTMVLEESSTCVSCLHKQIPFASIWSTSVSNHL